MTGASGTRRLRRSSVVASGSRRTPWASIEDRNHRTAWVPRSADVNRIAVHRRRRVTLVEGPEITVAEAVIDNGSLRHPHRPVRDRPPRQAGRRLGRRLPRRRDDAAVDHHGRQAPEGPLRLLPADGGRRGAHVRRRAASPARSSAARAGPSTDAILTCRLIDRPLRPSFVKGLRNEVQVVVTVLSLHPDDPYDVVAINARVAVDPALRPAVLRPDRRRPRRAHRRPVGRVPAVLRAGARRLRHGRRRPRRHDR